MESLDSDETRRLLELARSGQREPINLLLQRHRPFLRRMVELRLDPRLRARVDPSDVVQEAQLEAGRRLDDYLRRPVLPFRLWLRQLAYDQLLKACRRHLGTARRAVGREVPLPDQSSFLLGQQLLATPPSPSQHLAQRELARRVREAVSRLAEPDREVVVLRAFEGLSNQETARLLHIRPAAASQRYGRALLRLRQFLVDLGISEASS
jgi:RNA polymerase sigma-70 factor (ECF subfamily)